MQKLKGTYRIIVIMMLAAGLAGIFCYLVFWNGSPVSLTSSGMEWTVKQNELTSRESTVPILLYHNIDGKGPFSVNNEVLHSHFQMLKDKGIRVISLSKFIEKMKKTIPFNTINVALTFDDGFFSMYTKLLPLSLRFNYPVTLFVYTDNIYKSAKKKLTWTRLREMDSKGISIECHSISHPDLIKIQKKDTQESRKKLFEEIYLSKRIMELYLDKKIRFFAFPYGRYSIHLVKLCQLSGYERVFSTDYGPNIVTRDNYCLRRRHIKSNYSFDQIERIVE